MDIITQTQLEKDALAIQTATNKALRSIVAAKDDLNSAYNLLWNLPDDRLTEFLQYLYDNQKLEGVFTSHYIAGSSLNAILSNVNYEGEMAMTVAGRELTVSEDGIVGFVVPPVEEPEIPVES